MPTDIAHKPTQVILQIARSFPLLRSKLEDYNPERFHPQDLYEMSAGWSTSEIHLRNFVLTSWSPVWAKQKKCTFDLIAALDRFDDTNRQILAKWIATQCFPSAYL
jgi:hypothetical protein